ncbi:MAG TPA: diguanylate cyclase [Candidatus Elarobacter sp.]|jgi:diguanylate cyclase (GGDEF)-like protein/PAS domain S-box-containing protein|nr:diguanylate cyclase [Candidatus Elarobacter sp.]
MADPLPSDRGGAARRRRVFDTLDEGVIVQDAADGTVRDWNASAARLLALAPEQLRGRAPLDPDWRMIPETGGMLLDARDPVRSMLQRALERGGITLAIHPPHQPARWITVSSHVVHDDDEDGVRETIVSTMTDVTAQRDAERQNARYREIIDTLDASYRILEESPIGMCSVDLEGNVLRSNMAFLALGGVETTSILALVPEEDRATLRHEFARLMEGRTPSVRIETRVRRPTGAETWCEITGVAMRQGLPDAAILLIINDVTERRRREIRLRQLAERDPLTGLHNRRSFLHALRERLAALDRAPRRSGGDWALLVIDLDGFKEVNDTCGHAGGDAVLVAVADAIRARTRLDDTVGRLGGDEFAVLFRSELPDAAVVGEQIIARIERAARTVPGAPPVTASIGIARLRRGARVEEMLDTADRAMYRAKRAGKARVVEAAL